MEKEEEARIFRTKGISLLHFFVKGKKRSQITLKVLRHT